MRKLVAFLFKNLEASEQEDKSTAPVQGSRPSSSLGRFGASSHAKAHGFDTVFVGDGRNNTSPLPSFHPGSAAYWMAPPALRTGFSPLFADHLPSFLDLSQKCSLPIFCISKSKNVDNKA